MVGAGGWDIRHGAEEFQRALRGFSVFLGFNFLWAFLLWASWTAPRASCLVYLSRHTLEHARHQLFSVLMPAPQEGASCLE